VTVVDHVPLQAINAKAREVHFGRLAALLFFGVFMLLGWAAGWLFTGLVMCALAVKAGWQEARPPSGGADGSTP
jgi:hypothetical protein